MNDINEKKASIWCERFGRLMKENGYTQEAFLKEYRKKYGGGTQANVSRWLGVGRVIKKDGTPKGFNKRIIVVERICNIISVHRNRPPVARPVNPSEIRFLACGLCCGFVVSAC